jgi:D-alanyl-D-alanine carboxypeptidase/D-alanyl-D-alanine-endopeptidase (penicillin-binding protein 4)
LDKNRLLYVKNADTAVVPASNMKLITASATLGILGNGYVYRTRLFKKDNTLYLKGSGDPSFTTERLRRLLRESKEEIGETPVDAVITDESRFMGPHLGYGWEWDDEGESYAAPVSAMTCDANIATVAVTPGAQAGSPTTVSIANLPLAINNSSVTVAGSESSVSITRPHGQSTITVRGNLSLTAKPITATVSVDDPARITAHRMALLCAEEGIPLAQSVRIETGVTPADAEPLNDSVSAPLSELVKPFLKQSDNLYGECFLRTLTTPGSAEAGGKAVETYLRTRKVSTDGLNIADGSGLSRHNTVTARLLVQLLSAEVRNVALRDALPIGGVDGTLRNRFKGARVLNNVRAKTGTLSGASSLSGYVTTASGERLVFAILMNHYDRKAGASVARVAQDALVEAIAE